MAIQIKPQIDKLRTYARTKPKQAIPLIAGTALIALLLLSTLIAVVMQKDDTKPTQPVAVAEQRTAVVSITKDGFLPATINVQKGTKITWTNNDDKPHQLQANPHPTGESLPGLKSEIINNKQTYEYTADTAGTFGYHDQLNPTTNGTIQVQE